MVSRICIHCGIEIEAGRAPVPDAWRCNFCHQWQDEATCPTCGQRTTLGRLKSYGVSEQKRVGEIVAAIMPDIVKLVRSKVAEGSKL